MGFRRMLVIGVVSKGVGVTEILIETKEVDVIGLRMLERVARAEG